MKPIQEIYSAFSSPKKIAITMHQKPDPDAMGSSLGLYHFLIQFGHEVTVISPTSWADYVKWMPGCSTVIDYESQKEKADTILDQTDWLFCLDFNALYRTRTMATKIESISAIKILVDHHEEPHTAAFNYGISIIPKSSTSEMIYDLILDSGHAGMINQQIAECLYAGVMSDTGSFRYPVTTPSVHTMVAALKKVGIDHSRIHYETYDNFLENRMRFLGHVLLNRLDVYYEYNAALIYIPRADLLRYQIKTGDTEGLANMPLSISGIKFSALLIDRDEERRWSFRSKDDFDCNSFARKHFDGGGHYNAAGGRSLRSLEENARLFREALKEYKNQLQ